MAWKQKAVLWQCSGKHGSCHKSPSWWLKMSLCGRPKAQQKVLHWSGSQRGTLLSQDEELSTRKQQTRWPAAQLYQTVLVLLICNIKGPVTEKKGCRMRVTIKKNTREIVAQDYSPLSIIHGGLKVTGDKAGAGVQSSFIYSKINVQVSMGELWFTKLTCSHKVWSRQHISMHTSLWRSKQHIVGKVCLLTDSAYD